MWKTGWIRQVFGSWRREFVSLEVRTLNGPWRQGASLALGWVVLTLVPSMLQDVSIEGGPGALALLRDADTSCLRLTCLCLDLDLSLHFAICVWTASVTHKPYALDPDFDL